MSKARELAELSRTVSDSADAVAITIDSSENVTFANDITVTGAVTATDLTLSDGTNPTLTITDTTNTTSLVLTAGNLSTTIGNSTNHPLTFDTNNIERMRIDSSGNVEVKGGNELRVYRGDNGTYGSIKYLTGSGGLQLNDKNGDGISFVQNDGATEYGRFDGSGNLLVGKDSTSIGDAGHTIFASGEVFHTVAGTPLYVNRTGSDGPIQNFYKDGSGVGSINAQQGSISIGGNPGTGGIYFNGGTDVRPWNPAGNTNADNTLFLGSSNSRWEEFFCANSTINTSDRNEKQDIEALSDAEQRVAVAAKGLLRKYRWRDAVAEKGDDARIHFGIIAQDLQDAFTAEGLDAARYAMFCSDTWTNDDGSEQTRLGVRYSELLAFIISAI